MAPRSAPFPPSSLLPCWLPSNLPSTKRSTRLESHVGPATKVPCQQHPSPLRPTSLAAPHPLPQPARAQLALNHTSALPAALLPPAPYPLDCPPPTATASTRPTRLEPHVEPAAQRLHRPPI
eukprot:365122-Chlamydomonas_euryale.AAC.30